MFILNDREISSLINDYQNSYQGVQFPLDEAQKAVVKDTYTKVVMKCSSDPEFSSKAYHQSVVTDIAEGIAKGESVEAQVRNYYKSSYLSYFDNILGQGETDKIERALVDNNLTSDIFTGLKKDLDHDYKTTVNGNEIRIVQKVQKINGQSPVVTDLTVYLNGEEIYSYHKSKEELIEDLAIRKNDLLGSFTTKERKQEHEYTVVTRRKKNGVYYHIYYTKGHIGAIKNPNEVVG